MRVLKIYLHAKQARNRRQHRLPIFLFARFFLFLCALSDVLDHLFAFTVSACVTSHIIFADVDSITHAQIRTHTGTGARSIFCSILEFALMP